MLKKLIVVYNPRSSQHMAVKREVLTPARKLKGWLVGKYEVQTLKLHESADDFAKILHDGDLVVVAGGDGTAAMVANGILRSKKDVTMGVLGYGNFNDFARTLKSKRAVDYGGEYIGGVTEIVERYEAGKAKEIYPLEVKVDGKHWRYVLCYLSVGMMAASTLVFDEPKVRGKLQKKQRILGYSLWTLMKWYFKNRRQEFLPGGTMSGSRARLEMKVKTVKEEKDAEVASERGKVEEEVTETKTMGTELAEVKLAMEMNSAVKNEKKVAKAKRCDKESAFEKVAEKDVEKVEKSAKVRKQTKSEKPEKFGKPEKPEKQANARVKNRSKVQRTARKQVKKTASVEVRDLELAREFETVKSERNQEKKKFKRLLRAGRKEQLVEMKAATQVKLQWAGVQAKAKLKVVEGEAKAKLGHMKIKTQDKVAEWSEKVRQKQDAGQPEIIIEGTQAMEKKRAKSTKKTMKCAAEREPKKRFVEGATDYLAVNSMTVARIMRGGRYYRKPVEFRSVMLKLDKLGPLLAFMLRSVLWKIPGKRTRGDVIKFDQRAKIAIQAEGECEELEGVKRIEVKKANVVLKVV